jgi:superfamily II DNA or RNA helicase
MVSAGSRCLSSTPSGAGGGADQRGAAHDDRGRRRHGELWGLNLLTAITEHRQAEPVASPPLPERGQVVNVRGSNWAVTDVIAQGPGGPADEGEPGVTHVVSLQSLEDDQLGTELSVVWELEVGQTVRPDQGLPESIGAGEFDDPNMLAAFVDAVRWGAVTSANANAYQAPFRSGANVDPYQLEPLRRALQSARTNLLLADDVGLGKTIEAGMVIQELLLRHRARSVVIVCPPSLSLKWQDEMQEKFGLRFEIVNSELMARVRRTHGLNANPFRLFPRVIVSMAWLPSLRAQRLLRDVYADVRDASSARRYAFDVLVVDEAHHVAPASPTAPPGFKRYAVDSDRTIATRALAERCEHRLFLSATPHNGFTESFMALMEMIDDRRFKRGAILDERALKDIAVRRLKADVPEKGFRQRELKTITFEPDAGEAEHFAELDRILSASARANRQGQAGGIVAMLLKKRFLSSPWSFAQTLREYVEAEAGRGLDIDDEDRYYQEVLGSGQSDEEEGEADHPEFTALRRSKRSDPLVTATSGQIGELIAWGDGYQHKPDGRLRELIKFLDATCRPDGEWRNDRVVIFTEYAATLDWITDVLGQRGYRNGTELAVIQGSTPVEDRELIRARFTAPPDQHPVRVLAATDSAGEGIDLQDYCHRLVNFDIPFNPSRLEQRIGRIDRYGQQEVPEVYQLNPVPVTSAYAESQRFLVNLVKRKIDVVATDLGSVNQVVDMDAEIQDHFAPSGSGRKRKLTASDDGAVIINRVLAGGAELNKRLTELSRTYDQTKAGMHLTPENARRVVDTALELTGQPPLRPCLFDLDADVFEVPSLGPSWQPALRGLETRLKPDVPRPITFDDKGRGRGDVVHVHLGHAIAQRSARILRSALFSVDSPVHRVTAVVVDGLPQSCVAAVSRLVLVGRGGLRLHEEVFLTGIRLRGQALSEAKAEDVLDVALDAQDLVLAPPSVLTALAGLWNGADSPLRTRLLTAMSAKARSHQETVTEALLRRRDSDIDRAREIYTAFRINLIESRALLEAQIRSEEEKLFPDDQQRQRRDDLRGMEDRLDTLDDEEQREIAAIGARYADIQPHVTAAAVVFALTPQDAAAGRIGA